MIQVGMLLFDRVEELDIVGPYEVFAAAQDLRPADLQVACYALDGLEVIGNKRLGLRAHGLCADAPQLDVLLIPGGDGTRPAAHSTRLIDWVSRQAAGCRWVTSVCTGARVLEAAGVIDGKRITTYHGALDELRRSGRAAEVLDGVRYVRDGNLVTSAGVSAGIDMALWLLGQVTSPAFARQVQAHIEYFPAPPYTAETA